MHLSLNALLRPPPPPPPPPAICKGRFPCPITMACTLVSDGRSVFFGALLEDNCMLPGADSLDHRCLNVTSEPGWLGISLFL